MKTLFDPCPSGWRVPRSGAGNLCPWQSFTAGNGSWNDGGYLSSGRLWKAPQVYGDTAWYSANGLREAASGNTGYRRIGYYWSTTVSGPIPSRLRIDDGTVVPNNYTGLRGDGQPVRCVRE